MKEKLKPKPKSTAPEAEDFDNLGKNAAADGDEKDSDDSVEKGADDLLERNLDDSVDQEGVETKNWISRRDRKKLGAMALGLTELINKRTSDLEERIREIEGLDETQEKEAIHVEKREKLFNWQKECLEKILPERNVILSSPTGSGKTRVFMDWAKHKQREAEHKQDDRQAKEAQHKGAKLENAKREREKNRETSAEKYCTYITAPIKELSNQRFRELREQGLKVGLETGDCKNIPEDYDYLCCTQEIYTNKYMNHQNASLIVDEMHYIYEDGKRQRTYIDALGGTKAENVLVCSATFGNMGKMGRFLNQISRRDFMTYENHERLTDIEFVGKIPKREIKDALVVALSVRNCNEAAEELVSLRREEMTEREKMALTEREEQIKAVCEWHGAKYDSDYAYGVATYYGGKTPSTKACVADLFEKRLIDTVVGTDALALGVNFPIRQVVFTQLHKRYDGLISKNMFDQLAGLAGRWGYFDHGEVGYNDEFRNDPDLGQEYDKLVEKHNEDVDIQLEPDIGMILRGERTIEEEAEYIARISSAALNNVDEEEAIKRSTENWINQDIEEIHEFGECLLRKRDLTALDKLYIDREPVNSRDGDLARLLPEDSSLAYNDEKISMRALDFYFGEQHVRVHYGCEIWVPGENYITCRVTPIEFFSDEGASLKVVYPVPEDVDGEGIINQLRQELYDNSEIDYAADLESHQQELIQKIMDEFTRIKDEAGYRNFYKGVDKLESEEDGYLDMLDPEEFEEYVFRGLLGDDLDEEELLLKKRTKEVLAMFDHKARQLKREFDENIGVIYDSRRDVKFNCNFMKELIVKDGDPEEFLTEALVRNDEDWRGLMDMRSIVCSLPAKYRQKFDMVGIEERINEIDENILNGERGKLSVTEIEEAI